MILFSASLVAYHCTPMCCGRMSCIRSWTGSASRANRARRGSTDSGIWLGASSTPWPAISNSPGDSWTTPISTRLKIFTPISRRSQNVWPHLPWNGRSTAICSQFREQEQRRIKSVGRKGMTAQSVTAMKKGASGFSPPAPMVAGAGFEPATFGL